MMARISYNKTGAGAKCRQMRQAASPLKDFHELARERSGEGPRDFMGSKAKDWVVLVDDQIWESCDENNG